MKAALRRWLGLEPPEAYGSLTLTDEGLIFGFPAGREPTSEEVERFKVGLSAWRDDKSQTLLFPFPVNVTDLRHGRG